MSLLAEPDIATTPAARAAAMHCWAVNLAALRRKQPELAESMGEMPDDVEWVFARDGSLSARMSDGTWWAGCSVPREAGRKLLRTLEPGPLVNAYLSPDHGPMLLAARERIGPSAAMVALVPEPSTLSMILATVNFADEIAANRLWFAVGPDWAGALRRLLIDRPGLPPPGRFIRSTLTESNFTDAMIHDAQAVLSEIAAARSADVATLCRGHTPRTVKTDRLLVIAPSTYRLWDWSTDALRAAAESTGKTIEIFDSDDPAGSSPLALATAAGNGDAVLAADVYRVDAAGLVSPHVPWITWATRAGVRAFDTAAADRLILTDSTWATRATDAGWPARRVSVGAAAVIAPTPFTGQPALGVIADLPPVVMPPAVDDLSSHRLLWEHLDDEIDSDPMVVGVEPLNYLFDRAALIGIGRAELDVHAFVDGLIVPRWQRAVVRQLLKSSVPVRLFGTGWDELSAALPVTNQQQFHAAVTGSAALLHLWPGFDQHPIRHAGRPVVAVQRNWDDLQRAIRQAMTFISPAATPAHPTLADAIKSAMSQIRR